MFKNNPFFHNLITTVGGVVLASVAGYVGNAIAHGPTGGFADYLNHHPYLYSLVVFGQQYLDDLLKKYQTPAPPK